MKMDERGNRGAGREIWRVREAAAQGGGREGWEDAG